MRNIYHVIIGATVVVFIFVVWAVIATYAVTEVLGSEQTEEVTAEQTPKLYCQYSAGYGKRVWEYEHIGNDDIITDADDVFHLSVCEKWSVYEKSSN